MPMSDHYTPVSLLCTQPDNMVLLSSLLQDSVCPVVAMHFNAEEHTFSLLCNRFCWELEENAVDTWYRVHSRVVVRQVTHVKKRRFHQAGRARLLNLLQMKIIEENTSCLSLLFSGDCEITMHFNQLEVALRDAPEPWPTLRRPTHIHEHIEQMRSSI